MKSADTIGREAETELCNFLWVYTDQLGRHGCNVCTTFCVRSASEFSSGWQQGIVINSSRSQQKKSTGRKIVQFKYQATLDLLHAAMELNSEVGRLSRHLAYSQWTFQRLHTLSQRLIDQTDCQLRAPLYLDSTMDSSPDALALGRHCSDMTAQAVVYKVSHGR
jgi:hypothetical protein